SHSCRRIRCGLERPRATNGSRADNARAVPGQSARAKVMRLARWWPARIMRGALVGSCVVLGAATFAASGSSAPLPPAEDRDLAAALLKEMVEIRTTHDVGSTQLAHAIEEHLLRAGFAASDVVFVAPPEHPAKGNVIVRYRGKGRAKPVLFLGHLDV